MITLIEARNFRCLGYVRQNLGPFQVLVGPNGSGKTTFFDVIGLLGDILTDGLESAVLKRAEDHDFTALLTDRIGERIELAVEAHIPDAVAKHLPDNLRRIRYEMAITWDPENAKPALVHEQVILRPAPDESQPVQQVLFPEAMVAPKTIITAKGGRIKQRLVLRKAESGNDNFYSELSKTAGESRWVPSFKLGPNRSALANLPEDESKYPASMWLRKLLCQGLQVLMLNSQDMRRPSPPAKRHGFVTTGGNLPWLIHRLPSKQKKRWLAHIRTALPEVEDITTVDRPEDKHRYLKIHYRGGLVVPSWMASDGTLRLIALTLLAYLGDLDGLFLIEEPENGIHPQAVETVCQSLSSVYACQVLVATHSPVILSMVPPERVLCFAKDGHGHTAVVQGDMHPALGDWKGLPNLSVLYAAGVLS